MNIPFSSARIMFGIEGLSLTAQEKTWLAHPLTAGVILFRRNFADVTQLRVLTAAIRAIAPQALIAVDHEGGRVWRFESGFTRLPAMAEIGEKPIEEAKTVAFAAGFVMAYELVASGLDFSFAPILDLLDPISQIIHTRAFHQDPVVVATLATAFLKGQQAAGSVGVGKHFPGHGKVAADSHLTLPISETNWQGMADELLPFQTLIENGLEAIMPAHVLYEKIDAMPAGFSTFWLQQVLRKQLGFTGAIISDDLDMAGAVAIGDLQTRLSLALTHCDFVLFCNDFAARDAAFALTPIAADAARGARIAKLCRNSAIHERAEATYLTQAKILAQALSG